MNVGLQVDSVKLSLKQEQGIIDKKSICAREIVTKCRPYLEDQKIEIKGNTI